jgi:putative surface-exposed virulence protein
MFKRKTTTTLATTALAAALAALVLGPSAGAATLPISSCGQVVTTSVVLTKDLVCAGSGMFVSVSYGITIDLNGHVLKGDGQPGHIGVADFGGYDKLTIKNGVIRNFDDGIRADNAADNLTVSNVVTTGNAGQGVLIDGAFAKIVSSTAAGNGQTGIQVQGDASSVTSSTATGNGGEGIWVAGASPSVKSSRAFGNNADGVLVDGDSAKISSTTADGNTKYGVYVIGDSASIQSSTASGNGSDGIRVGGDAAVIKGNRAEANSFPGGLSDDLGNGIEATGFTTPPLGTNVARGNDQAAECAPKALCPVANSKVKAAALPISYCEQTVTTDAYLAKDLVCPGDTGIVVGASEITIDLNGHVLKGDGQPGHYGIDDQAGYDKVTIKNGVLRNFEFGVNALNSADNITVSNVVASGNTETGGQIYGAAAKITSSTAAGNGQTGLTLGSDSASVTSSLTAGNGFYGIFVSGAGPSIKSSSAVGNAGTGVFVGGDSASVSSTITSANGGTGLTVLSASASIKSTTASGNEGFGIALSGDQATLTGNRADGNGYVGGTSDGVGLGIRVQNFTTAPVGTNLARGNDQAADCDPGSLC